MATRYNVNEKMKVTDWNFDMDEMNLTLNLQNSKGENFQSVITGEKAFDTVDNLGLNDNSNPTLNIKGSGYKNQIKINSYEVTNSSQSTSTRGIGSTGTSETGK